MIYGIEIKPSCKESINKLCRKNPVLEKATRNKIEQILENPQHFKPLRHGLAGERRVHIMKSFVLKYEADENTKIVCA
ncbi:MAG TPA: type II toxin-antitoxin system RelE/ParE family toxin [Candidatus Nanoarchaeia archaeon]|nr:type II toxin-antitoxin system RelE/ParE family toxin [Candidatus Nanoarchaeia archaeon]